MFRLPLRNAATRPRIAQNRSIAPRTCATCLGAAPRAATRHYNYLAYAPLQPRPSRFRRFLTASLTLVSAAAFAYYMWWPKHTFPRSVAKILRKGLWAELIEGEQDFQLALKYYLEALDECAREHVDVASDEYTGIQLKVCEMYERLGMIAEATFVYNEIALLYLLILRAPPRTAEDYLRRERLIQRDLRVAIKLAELNRALNPLLTKAILITHLLVAQEEVDRRMLGEKAVEAGPTQGKLDSRLATVVVIEPHPEAWHPFAREFFQAMDFLSSICVALGDIASANALRIAMTTRMMSAGMDPESVMLSQYNTALLLYFQLEQLQATEQVLRRRFAEAAGVEYAKVQALADPLLAGRVGDAEANAIRDKIARVVLPEERREYEAAVAGKEKLVDMAVLTYELVIQLAKNLPAEIAKDNAYVSEIIAMATYGLGVVNLHLAHYDKAERLLREARVRSKSCGYDILIEEIERELAKLFKEKRVLEGKAQREPEQEPAIELDIHFGKRDAKRGGA